MNRFISIISSLACVFCLVAGSILSKMDPSINPCDDFYTFSCGGWLKENPIPEDASSYGIYPWLRQHVDIRLKGLSPTKFLQITVAFQFDEYKLELKIYNLDKLLILHLFPFQIYVVADRMLLLTS